MKTEFRKAVLPQELRSLMAFDRQVFLKADLFDKEYWNICEPHWMLMGKAKVGCCAFERNIDFHDESGKAPRLKGSLYISTTGIHPRYQNQGFGALLKAWELAYARYHGFNRVITTCRKRNKKMIALNRQFGFRIVRTLPRYFREPADSAVLMELLFTHAN